MKAFVLEEKNKAVIKNMPIPQLDSDYGAILKPVAVSVCSGTKKREDLILGHESVAEVFEVGKKVEDFKRGDLVAVPAMTPNWRDIAIQEKNFLHAGRPFSSNALGRTIDGVL